MTVDNPIHPFHGRTLTVRYVERSGSASVVHADHPGGGTLTLPESMLRFRPALEPGSAALFDTRRLLELTRCVEELGTRTARVDDTTLAGDRPFLPDPPCSPPDAPSPDSLDGDRRQRPASARAGAPDQPDPPGRDGRTGGSR